MPPQKNDAHNPDRSMSQLFRAHPWHGVPIGDEAPEVVSVYVEMVPTDTIKYELDKHSGLLKVDRPQRYSNVCPACYGFVPQTYCAERIGALCCERTSRTGIVGDDDPLDICVLMEKSISRPNILLRARPIGGLRMIDGNEADDKIVAVMTNDAAYSEYQDISDCPELLIERLMHYFLTYKTAPESTHPECEIAHIYGREEALKVIRASQEDYREHFPELEEALRASRQD
jgi:inorganic pyrophosphatase